MPAAAAAAALGRHRFRPSTAWLVLALLLTSRSASHRPLGFVHAESDDCQLNGEIVSGACRCDKGWEGPDCGQLAIDPQRPSTVIWPATLPNDATRTSAWGGTIAKDESGTYHLWDNSVCEDAACMHYSAQFVHATANALDGPFRAESIAFAGAECPHVTAADGHYYMLGVDHLKINTTTNCTGGRPASQPLPRNTVVPSRTKPPATYQEAETGTSAWFIARGSHPSGPWTMSYPALIRSNDSAATVDATAESGLLLGNNPCALSLRNGSIAIAYRYNTAQPGASWRVAVAVGTSWSGPFTIVKAPVVDLPNEDPFIWQNQRGYHILTHHFNESSSLKTYTAQHLYSTDLLNWSAGPLAPYSTTVDFGTKPPLGFANTVVSFDRRERPALVLDSSGNPELLVSGVEANKSLGPWRPGHGNASCVSLTIGTPLKFDDETKVTSAGPVPGLVPTFTTPMPDDSTIVVEVDASDVVGTIAPIHNLTEGPVTQSDWLAASTRPDKSSKDYTAGFMRAGVGRSRTHGVGCIDMDNLWRPFPRYRDQDPTLEANYNWTIVDECVRSWYFNSELQGKQVEMFVRFGHSHANRTLHPAFSAPPDDFNVFASVCLHIIRHLNDGWDNGFRLGVRDFTVWNEPSSTIEVSSCCPFWVGTAQEYAQLYAATYRTIKPMFGGNVRIGAAVNGALSQSECTSNQQKADHCFDWHILGNISALGVSIDFVEYHWYGRLPGQLAYNLVEKGTSGFPSPTLGGALSLEGSIIAAGFPRTTPILLGEWSRFIPAYAMDGPGAAFLACCLASLNTLHPANSDHNVEDGFVFAAGKIWDGSIANAPNLHGGVLWEVWHNLHTRWPHMLKATATMGLYNDGTASDSINRCCEFHAVAGWDGMDSLTVLLANYNDTTAPGRRVPSVGLDLSVNLRVGHLPWSVGQRMHWQQYDQANGSPGQPPGMRLVREGTVLASTVFEQRLVVGMNAFSLLRVAKESE